MAHVPTFAQKKETITAPRIDLFTDVGGTFGAYYNGVEIGTGYLNSVGTFGSTPNTAGQSLSNHVLTAQPADATRPGGISTGAQTIPGVKTFGSAPILSTGVYGVTPSSSQKMTINAAGALGSVAFNTFSRVPIVALVAGAVRTTTAVAFTAGTYGDVTATSSVISVPAGNWCVLVTAQITGSDATGTNTFLQLDPTPLAVQSCSHGKSPIQGVEDAARFPFCITAASAWSFGLNSRQDNAGGAGTGGYTQAEVVLWKIQ